MFEVKRKVFVLEEMEIFVDIILELNIDVIFEVIIKIDGVILVNDKMFVKGFVRLDIVIVMVVDKFVDFDNKILY